MRVDHRSLREIVGNLLTAAGVDDSQKESVSENLTWCDMVGRHNHGIERLPILIKRVSAGVIKCPCNPEFEVLGPSIQRLNADNGFGHHAGCLAVDRACDLAEEQGVGIVGVRESNFFGAGSFYVNRAAERNMISLVLSNSFPKVAALGGTRSSIGTNPLAFGAPRRDGQAILVDLSTAAVAGSSIREAISKGQPLENGIAIDRNGSPVNDPAKVSQATLLPAAAGKGYGLGLMVEMLSAVLTGAGIANEVASMYGNFDEGGHNGHMVLAIDPSRWMTLSDFFDRVDFLSSALKQSGAAGAVRLPGDERWTSFSASLTNGVLIDDGLAVRIEALAADLDVPLVWGQVCE